MCSDCEYEDNCDEYENNYREYGDNCGEYEDNCCEPQRRIVLLKRYVDDKMPGLEKVKAAVFSQLSTPISNTLLVPRGVSMKGHGIFIRDILRVRMVQVVRGHSEDSFQVFPQ